ncbi:hypothetical protein C1646_753910 [Rhizophagus diaphanus]|nr:hypothetical protein C1646_753910 [Rhizophagus diaphanus] [Rhizophagus sp. MUCL 43196]
MENQMQNSIRYSVVSTTIEISKHIEIGKLIGRKGRKLKPIAERLSPEKRIDEAKFQIDKLLKGIETRNQRKDIEKVEKNVRISDNSNHQKATPRNHKDNDLKDKRKRFKRKMSHTTKTRQSRNKGTVKRNVPVNQ